MNILITQHRLTDRGDSELYTLELAHRLTQQGHCVIVYCPRLGPLADAFLAATIPVVAASNTHPTLSTASLA